MEALLILLPISILLGFGFLAMFIYSVKDGQLDDLDGPAKRILFDDINTKKNTKHEQGIIK